MRFIRYLFFLLFVVGAFSPQEKVRSQAETALSIQPVSVTADHCSLPVITIRLDNVTNLTAYTVRLTFEPQYLRVLEVSNGDFLKDEMPAPDNAIDNVAGTVRFGMARFGADTSPESGSGALVLLRVMALQAGQTAHLTIDTAEAQLVGWPEGTAISYQAANGIIYTGDCVASEIFLPLVLR